jgi:hypothetical protein
VKRLVEGEPWTTTLADKLLAVAASDGGTATGEWAREVAQELWWMFRRGPA